MALALGHLEQQQRVEVGAACQPAITELTEEQKAEIAETVRQVNADYWAAWARMENLDECALCLC